MAQTKRRSVIKLAGSAAAVASTGMAGILATGRTPAFAQQKNSPLAEVGRLRSRD